MYTILHFRFGQHCLSWFRSYLSGRTQFVELKHFRSELSHVTDGVPQGSVLGPLLFIIYVLPVWQFCMKFGIHFHCYANNSQLYMSFMPNSVFPSSSPSSWTTTCSSEKHGVLVMLPLICGMPFPKTSVTATVFTLLNNCFILFCSLLLILQGDLLCDLECQERRP